MNETDELNELKRENERLKRQIVDLTDLVLSLRRSRARSHYVSGPVLSAFRQMTPKQHGTMQMLLGAASNKEIARRFNVSESTAKAYVRGVMRKLGVNKRETLILKVKSAFEVIEDDLYRQVSRGIPKDWHAHFHPAHPVNGWLIGGSRRSAKGAGK